MSLENRNHLSPVSTTTTPTSAVSAQTGSGAGATPTSSTSLDRKALAPQPQETVSPVAGPVSLGAASAAALENLPLTVDEGTTYKPTPARGRGRGRKRGSSNASPRELPDGGAAKASAGVGAPSSVAPVAPVSSTEDSADGASPVASKKPRRRKVDHACIYCRRSHMTCDEGRPCSRCIRRNIGHLCRDEPKKKEFSKIKSEDSVGQPGGGTLISTSGSYALGANASAVAPSAEWGADSPHNGNSNGNDNNPLEPMPASSHQATAMVLTSQNHSGIYGRGSSSLVFQELVDHRKDSKPVAAASEVHQPDNTSLPQTLGGGVASTAGGNKPIGGKSSENLNLLANRSPFNDWSALGNQSILAHTSEFNQNLFFSEHANSEFASLGDFLTMIEDPNANPDLLLHNGLPSGLSSTGPLSANVSPGLSRKDSGTDLHKQGGGAGGEIFDANAVNKTITSNGLVPIGGAASGGRVEPVVSDSARDKFFLTAADPSVDVSPEERLKQVIRAKVEAGLLQPFNYARGYARLQKYMDNYMNQSSKQRILKPLSIFRPAFRAIAQSLMDIDLVLVEEAFERMLLDYDRVFTSMAIPACLWRRTGEIYRGNKEFAGLVEVNVDDLRDGKLAIYELMSEESAVNYWEKYGNIAFDSGQKAVLTSCNLRTRDRRKRRACCFSFTIQRDRYNM
ncbi:hypothetical protein D0Z00_001059 [Geotrichum galactomycetum]|uniref:Uncharacterized protein n=1 Tax=Geotrichum galactomycetum TaxID=27317 RepID=A0ACB6V7Y0_9ASCO|nr:hypothetical protein D0Z00_001059 [Geotrichum candidum]